MNDQLPPGKRSFGRIGILMGGCSSEREISLKSGKAVLSALLSAGCDTVAVDLQTTDEKIILHQIREAKVDIVFLVLHGKFGEDGTIQIILDRAGIPYTGSDAQASRLAMDKAAMQTLLIKHHIQVPDFIVVEMNNQPQIFEWMDSIGGGSVVVKPSNEGSSIGITVVNQKEQLTGALKKAFSYGDQVILEKFIAGREITSGILAGEALPLVEIQSPHQFFDFSAKYDKGLTEYRVPAPIDNQQTRMIQEISQKVFHLAGCRDLARSDFIFDQSGRAYFLEINTIPEFTEMSLLPKAAMNAGLSFSELCVKIIGFAAARNLLRK